MLWKHCAFWLHCPVVTSLFPGSDKGGSDHSGIGWGSGPHQEVRCVHNITTCIHTDYCMASVCMAYTSELGCFPKWMPMNAWLQPGLPHSTQSDNNHGDRPILPKWLTQTALYMTSSASGFTALLHNYSSEQLEVTWSIPSCLSGRHIPC